MNFEKLILDSIQWRKENCQWGEDQALRLFAGLADGVEGLLIEKLGKFVLATLYFYHADIEAQASQLLSILSKELADHRILIKVRARSKSNDYFYLHNELYQASAVLTCYEGDCAFEVHCDPRHDYGLYLDTKAARNWVRDFAKEKRVLNLFSYTCAFAVAAMKGQASEVVNIDPAKEYLDWGGRNALLNHIVFKRYQDTTQSYLSRLLRRLENGKDVPYDFTIVDPPAFLVGRGDERLARKMWPEWMEKLAKSDCRKFLVVINDKDLAKHHHLPDFLQQGLSTSNPGQLIVEKIAQSPDVLGRNASVADPHYYLPEVFIVSR